jgi:putative endonuclease
VAGKLGSGCGAVWLARVLWEHEVAGSNPATPTILAVCLRSGGSRCSTCTYSKAGGRAGSTQNIEDRLRRHNQGRSKATRCGVPWVLMHTESFQTRAEAAQRERHYKTGRGREELRLLLESRG